MLSSAIWILLVGLIAGEIAGRWRSPPLMGMILAGILLGPEVGDHLSPEFLDHADSLRTIAVTIILMKAGLGLDREKLAAQGTVAVRLGILPGICEAIVVAVVAMILFKFNFPTGLLLGCIVGAESPAVIVPGMLYLKRTGWGVSKGIPDAILTGSALSDVLLLLLFSLLLNFLSQGNFNLTALAILPLQVLFQVALGLGMGYLGANLIVFLFHKHKLTQNRVEDVVLAACLALLLVIVAEAWPYFSGYLAVMALGFFLVILDAPLARTLRNGFDSLWVVGQIFLFVLLGAQIELDLLGNMLLPGIVILTVGLLLGRTIGWYLSTLGSNWNWREKLFLLPGNSAKATVQAAIGAIPLARGIEHGETMLAIAALSILITAPLGAWAIPIVGPKLLAKGTVDPAKVSVSSPTLFLAVVDSSSTARIVLSKVADLARRSNGEVIVLQVIGENNQEEADNFNLPQSTKRILVDIPHQSMAKTTMEDKSIIQIAEESGVIAIVTSKENTQTILKTSNIPLIIV